MKRPQRGLNWHLNTRVWKGRLALLFSAYYPEPAPPSPRSQDVQSSCLWKERSAGTGEQHQGPLPTSPCLFLLAVVLLSKLGIN